MAELVDWMHHESITRAATNSGTTMCENPYFGKVWQGENPKQTNADRFRSMTDEELAEWFAGHDAGLIANVLNNDYVAPTKDGWLEWLKEEATE